ncbi:MAG: PqqD family peptide modification chaperone [Desulfuromonadales bacterium]|nr:PqqD family peptide modification chaperone [Desulfuromonadales bacterium]
MEMTEAAAKSQASVVTITPFVHFVPFADGGVLFRPGGRRLWVLNAPSAFIWCLLDPGDNLEGLASRVAARFAIDQTTALRDVTLTLEAFTKEGLFSAAEVEPATVDQPFVWLEADSRAPAGPGGWAVTTLFQAPGQVVEFLCQDLLAGAEFARLVSHLGVAGQSPVTTRLAVAATSPAADSWDILVNGSLLVTGALRNEIVPQLMTILFIRSSELLADKLLFHAAALGRGERAILFPAETGGGKTTLAAALATQGYLFYSDELAAVDRSDLRLCPVALPMSIKPGSVPVLEEYYPGLTDYPVHLRADGQLVRYLPPPDGSSAGSDRPGAPIEAIIFPRYRPATAGVELLAMAKSSALQTLCQAGSSDRPLEVADVEAMIALVEGCRCYTLEYADLQGAIDRLATIFP